MKLRVVLFFSIFLYQFLFVLFNLTLIFLIDLFIFFFFILFSFFRYSLVFFFIDFFIFYSLLDNNEKKIVRKFLKRFPKFQNSDAVNFGGFRPHDKVNYYGLLIAQIICSVGFDGWFIEENTIIQRWNISLPYFFQIIGKNSEILLCPPI